MLTGLASDALANRIQEQGQRGASLHRSGGVACGLAGDWFRIDDREAPLVELDPLGQKLRTEPVALAGDRIDAQALHRSPSVPRAGIGSTRRLPSQRPRRCNSASGAKTSSALVAKAAAPSGWLQAPRPRTWAIQRSSCFRSSWLRCAASRSKARAIASRA